MSYGVQQPIVEGPRRPATVGLAAVLLAVMGLGGLTYAVATLSVTPGVVDRFRQGTTSADSVDVDGLISVVWVAAAIGTVLAVLLFALYLVLALSLRRGSNAARVVVWVLSGLGLLAGCVTTITVLAEQSGTGVPGSLGVILSNAYPGGWIGLNIALAIAQMVGYAVIGLLLIFSPGAFFSRRPAQPPSPSTYGAISAYGATSPYGPPPGYGPPAGSGPPPRGYGPARSAHPTPGYGQPAAPGSPFGYGSPSDYERPAGSPDYASSPKPAPPPPGQPGPPPGAGPVPGPDDEFWSRPSE